MIKYLKGSDSISDPIRQKARLSGIAHELYIMQIENKGVNYDISSYGTLYGNKIFQKKVDSGSLEKDGSKKWNYSNDWVLEIDTESEEYSHMIQLHKDKLVDTLVGWDLT